MYCIASHQHTMRSIICLHLYYCSLIFVVLWLDVWIELKDSVPDQALSTALIPEAPRLLAGNSGDGWPPSSQVLYLFLDPAEPAHRLPCRNSQGLLPCRPNLECSNQRISANGNTQRPPPDVGFTWFPRPANRLTTSTP